MEGRLGGRPACLFRLPTLCLVFLQAGCHCGLSCLSRTTTVASCLWERTSSAYLPWQALPACLLPLFLLLPLQHDSHASAACVCLPAAGCLTPLISPLSVPSFFVHALYMPSVMAYACLPVRAPTHLSWCFYLPSCHIYASWKEGRKGRMGRRRRGEPLPLSCPHLITCGTSSSSSCLLCHTSFTCYGGGRKEDIPGRSRHEGWPPLSLWR